MRSLAQIVVPIVAVFAFPVLMLVFPSERTVIRLWAAAMLIISFAAGQEISRLLSKKAALAWLVGDVIALAALMASGVLSLKVGSLEYELGLLAVMFVGLALPASAMQAKIIEERRRRASMAGSPGTEEGSGQDGPP